MGASPLGPHSASPAELADRLAAERRGAPFLLYRDAEGRQAMVELGGERVTIGRRAGNDVALVWDVAVSRLHATIERVGMEWAVHDDGLSRHGTFVNGERLSGRHRLADGDVIFLGETSLVFVASTDGTRTTAASPLAPVRLTPAQRRVLVALCRPFRDATYASPASNRQIADELMISVDAVKARMKELFAAFEVGALAQNEKRSALAVEAMRRGVVTARDL